MTKTRIPSRVLSPDEEPTLSDPLPFGDPREDDVEPVPLPGDLEGSADHAGMGRGDHPRHARSKSHDRS